MAGRLAQRLVYYFELLVNFYLSPILNSILDPLFYNFNKLDIDKNMANLTKPLNEKVKYGYEQGYEN